MDRVCGRVVVVADAARVTLRALSDVPVGNRVAIDVAIQTLEPVVHRVREVDLELGIVPARRVTVETGRAVDELHIDIGLGMRPHRQECAGRDRDSQNRNDLRRRR